MERLGGMLLLYYKDYSVDAIELTFNLINFKNMEKKISLKL